MDPLDRLDSERGGKFRIRLDGDVHELASPLDLSWSSVSATLIDGPMTFRHFLPGAGAQIPVWKIQAAFEAWRARYGLPSRSDTNRLLYYVKRYPDAIEADLMRVPGLPPMTELWQTRQWRRLLNAIDHLPRNSFFAEAAANDDEHVEALLRAQESVRGMDQAAPRMPHSAFSDEVAVLADAVDGIRQVVIAIISANSAKGAATPNFEPYPRPVGAAARIKHKVMLEKHERLADRMLARRQRAAQN